MMCCSRSSCLWRAVLAFAVCVVLEVMVGCGGPAVTSDRSAQPGDVSRSMFSDEQRRLAEVEVLRPSDQSAHDAVGDALQLSSDAARAAAELQRGGADELYLLTDAERLVLEAYYRVDRAVNLATLRAAPSAEEERAGIEVMRASREREVPPGMLDLYVVNNGERARIELYDADGRMRDEAVDEASRLMRDQRADRARSVNPRLLAMLYFVGQHFDRRVEIISGYRVRGVNASDGSRHGFAAACDIRLPNVSNREIARFVEARFARIGVGIYPTSGFVHIDTRERSFFWTDRSGPGQRSRLRPRDPYARPAAESDPTLRTPHLSEALLFGGMPAEGVR